MDFIDDYTAVRLLNTMSGFVSELPRVDIATFARSYAAQRPERDILVGARASARALVAQTSLSTVPKTKACSSSI
jgi:hypothetical protein